MIRKCLSLAIGTALLMGLISAGLAIDAAPYLRMGVGARPLGLGWAFTPLADDATSSVWNPAGLPGARDLSFTLYTARLSLDRKHSFVGIVKSVGERGAIGFAWINAGVGNIKGWDAAGNPTEGTFSYNSNAIALSYGHAAEKVSFGAGLKILTDKFTAEGYDDLKMGFGGLDIGVIYKAFDGTVSCGAALRNLLGKLGDEGSIPVVVDLGAAFHLMQGNKATLAFGISKEFVSIAESTTAVKLGVEYWMGKALAIRAGGSHTGDRRTLYAGFSVRVAGLQFDYAYSPEDETATRIGGSTHFMSLSYTY